jgi:4-amino-4-deoxy-L-arabinose transferase-like glycosyltransferase
VQEPPTDLAATVTPATAGDAGAPSLAARLRRALVARYWATPPSVRWTVAVFFLVNAVLLTGYFWSRGGQTVRVRVEARGNHFAAFVDGELKSAATFEAPAKGGVALAVLNTGAIPSLPEPRGIDWVRVTDLQTGDVLFADDFSPGYEQRWTVAGPWRNDGGVVGIPGDGTLLLPADWTDYAVDVQLKNVVGAAVLVRAQDSKTGVVFSLRPFRQQDTGLALINGDKVVTTAPSGLVIPGRGETIKSMVAMVLRPYFTIFLLLSIGFGAVTVLQFVPFERVRVPRSTDDGLPPIVAASMSKLPWLAAGAVAAGAFGVALFLMRSYTQSMPHVQDSVTYVFQAKMLASGRLFGHPPPVPQVFDFETPPFLIVQSGKWASVYSFGHSLALAVGAWFGAMWVVPPLLGAGCIALTYAIGQKAYNARVGLLATVLMASSPFFFMTASEFMSHNTTTFYILASLFFLMIAGRRPLLYGALGGLFFGLAFNARQLEAATLVLPFAALLLSPLVRSEDRRMAARQIGAFVAAGLVMFVVYLLYNYVTRGDIFDTGYAAAGFKNHIGFGGEHSVAMGIANEQVQMALLVPLLNGWPIWAGLGFVLLPFVLATRKLWDWFFLSCAVLLIGVYTLYIGHGIMYGPRYWYPAAPFLMLLAARGADRAATVIAGAAHSLRSIFTRSAARPAVWAGVLVVYILVAVLVRSSIKGWLLSEDNLVSADFVPGNAVSLKSFNQTDDRLITLIDGAHLKNALVLVEPCTIWSCYGSVFWLNSPSLHGDVVIARDLAAHRPELFAAYPDRNVYLASYQDRFLVPFGSPMIPGATPPPNGGAAPVAKDIPVPPTPSPTPTATPDVGAAARRDAQRRRDLDTIAAALRTYRERKGAYPVASALQSFCRYRELDAGCKVLEVVESVPSAPDGGGDYGYLSDGTTYYLFAAMEESGDTAQCPAPLPPDLAPVPHLYCLKGGP